MKLAVCPGSFDPIHNGHVEVITRATKIFSQGIVVAVTHNPQKKTLFTLEERLAMVREVFRFFDGVRVEPVGEGLITDFVQRIHASAVIKGLRTPEDFAYEAPMSTMNRHLGGVETVFLSADPRYSHLSSSLIREVSALGGDITDFVPRSVAPLLGERRGARRS